MNSNFDFYKKIESTDISLCNPDGKPLCVLDALDRSVKLRFNDISEISFNVPLLEGKEKYYALVESKRLINVDNIGWFQISSANEVVRGDVRTKQVTAQSLQVVFKNKGFVREGRVYMFYNPNDPTDAVYQSSDTGAMPSIVGQLHRQLGIDLQVSSTDREILDDFKQWTLVYVPRRFFFEAADGQGLMYTPREGAENICRSFTDEDTTYGYDFMVNDVSQAFEVVFEFDYLHHAIKVKTIDEITKPTDIYLSFGNLVNELSLREDSDDIVTVLSCNGKDLDIRTVNPMGTNYLVNFDYYAKEVSDDGKIAYPWMSRELIEALKLWKEEWKKWQQDDSARTGHTESYQSLVKRLQQGYQEQTEVKAQITAANLRFTDLCTARDQFIDDKDVDEKAGVDIEGGGYIMAEKVAGAEGRSLLPNSPYAQNTFDGNSRVKAYKNAPRPTKDGSGKCVFTFSGESKEGTASEMIQAYADEEDGEDAACYMYFSDSTPATDYCKIVVAAKVEVAKDEDGVATTNGSGRVTFDDVAFDVTSAGSSFSVRCPDGTTKTQSTSNSYFIYNGIRYKVTKSADNIIAIHCYYVNGFERYSTYQAAAGYEGFDGWCTLWEKHIAELNGINAACQAEIDEINGLLQYISDRCEVRNFIARQNGGEALAKELDHYWIEGDYENDNLAALDDTTMAETIELAKQLMEAGEKELEKVSKPTFEMSVDAINFIRIPEFAKFTQQLELGRTITIEKDDETHYEPALMSIEYSLDAPNAFTLTFSTAAKNCEAAKTFADLIKESSSTSRKVSANWSMLTDYARNKQTIQRLTEEPLNRTLRVALDNLSNQEFTVDTTGILGRKRDINSPSGTGFADEQVRIVNNTIVFTRDNWKTAATALGKITFDDGSSAYGLVAEVLVGNLIFGEQVHVGNGNGNIVLDENGITIKDKVGNVHFRATPDGTVTVSGYATSGDLSNYATSKDLQELSSQFDVKAGEISAEVTSVKGEVDAVKDTYAPKEAGLPEEKFGYCLQSNGFRLYDQDGDVLTADSKGLEVRGKITSDSGRIAGLLIARDERSMQQLVEKKATLSVSVTIPHGTQGFKDDNSNFSYFSAIKELRFEDLGITESNAILGDVYGDYINTVSDQMAVHKIDPQERVIEIISTTRALSSNLALDVTHRMNLIYTYYITQNIETATMKFATADNALNITTARDISTIEASELRTNRISVANVAAVAATIGNMAIGDSYLSCDGVGFDFGSMGHAPNEYTAILQCNGNIISVCINGQTEAPNHKNTFAIEYKDSGSETIKVATVTVPAGKRIGMITINTPEHITEACFAGTTYQTMRFYASGTRGVEFSGRKLRPKYDDYIDLGDFDYSVAPSADQPRRWARVYAVKLGEIRCPIEEIHCKKIYIVDDNGNETQLT